MEALNLIGGRWSPAGATMDGHNPSTGAVIVTAARSGAAEVDDAVAAAADAAQAWASTPGPARGDVLFRAAELVARDAKALVDSVVEEVGKPVVEARGEVARTAAILRYFGGEGRRAGGAVVPSDGAELTLTLRQSVGMTALITPWNFPLAIPAWKLGPALVSGNTVVLKPAEQATRTATMLVQLLVEAGLPPGVLNVVLGDAVAGRALVEHPTVRAISFTGSGAAGAAVRVAAAERGVRVQVEMGGKNIAVVLGDADLERAAADVAAGAFAFAGQKCTATGLCLVEQPVAAAFADLLGAATRRIVVGSPFDEATVCGPVIDLAAVERAVAAGASVAPAGANFVAPQVVPDAALDAPIAREELFTPVLPVASIDTLDDAIAVAASLPTGLSAALHSDHAPSVLTFLRRMPAGVLAVNRPTTGLAVQAPFGGLKASGSEHKEQGPTAVDFYTDVKTAYWTT